MFLKLSHFAVTDGWFHASGAQMREVEQLHEDLFATYNKIGRPNKNATEKVIVHFSSFLLQLIDVVTKFCFGSFFETKLAKSDFFKG